MGRINILRVGDIVLVFLFIYGITLNAVPFTLSKFILLYLIVRVNKRIFFDSLLSDKMLRYTIIAGLISSIYFFFITVTTGNYNFGFLHSLFWYFGEGVIGAYLLFLYLSNKYDGREILYLITIAIFIQSIFVILSFVFVPFRDFINSILAINDERALSTYRMKGFSNSGGAGLSYLQTMGVLFAAILWLTEQKRKRKSILVVFIVCILFSQLFIARTGLIFSGMLIVVTYIQNAMNRSSLASLLKQALFISIFVIVAFQVLVAFIPSEQASRFEERIIGRSFEFIQSFEETGEIRTNSTDALLDRMYILPQEDHQIVFGMGLWDSPRGTRDYMIRKVQSDVGYVRAIYAGGIVMAILLYSIYLKYLKTILKFNYSKPFRIILLSLIVIFILGEMKEPFLIRGSGIIKCLFLLYFCVKSHNSFIFKQKNLVHA